MSEDTNDTAGIRNLEELLSNARNTLAEIMACVETAKSGAAAVSEFQKASASTFTDAQTKLAEITAAATQAVAAMTQVTDNQAVVATKSEHIQKAQEHANAVRAELDRKLTAATQQTTEAEGLKSRAQSAADTAATLPAELRTAKGAVEKDGTKIPASRKTAEASAIITKDLADKSALVEERIKTYENRLAELEKECADQLKNITDLLPGATAAGLAHAFDERRKTFLKPFNRWQWVFVGSVAAIVILAITGLWQVYKSGTAPTCDELLRLWLSRLPVAGALVWLALHASREAALGKRLEEDYGINQQSQPHSWVFTNSCRRLALPLRRINHSLSFAATL